MYKMLTVLSLALLCSNAIAVSMYQWTDDRGGSQFGQQPPADRPYRIVDINTPPPPGGVLRERQPLPPIEAKAPQDPDERAANRAREAELQRHCEQLNKNLETLVNNPRLTRTSASGEVERIGEDERQKMILDARNGLEERCN
ncbi:DUF4124 domain-containing protein [Pseudomonas saliphila]|uniref:DUF4124 domain-containing protein n=1 Tax=Pseudomonas saliphila TaxID=2586906 RepID=UPI001238A712|nr:DUF4124 domain-containing protein [Pseudomonas saliphila]